MKKWVEYSSTILKTHFQWTFELTPAMFSTAPISKSWVSLQDKFEEKSLLTIWVCRMDSEMAISGSGWESLKISWESSECLFLSNLKMYISQPLKLYFKIKTILIYSNSWGELLELQFYIENSFLSHFLQYSLKFYWARNYL